MNYLFAHAGETHNGAAEEAVQNTGGLDVSVYMVLFVTIVALALVYVAALFISGKTKNKSSVGDSAATKGKQ